MVKFFKNVNVSQRGTGENLTTTFYSENTKLEIFWWRKHYKKSNNKKQVHIFKVYARTYDIEILNSFNAELQLKNTEFVTSQNHVIEGLCNFMSANSS